MRSARRGLEPRRGDRLPFIGVFADGVPSSLKVRLMVPARTFGAAGCRRIVVASNYMVPYMDAWMRGYLLRTTMSEVI